MQIELDNKAIKRIEQACVDAAVSAVDKNTEAAIQEAVADAVQKRIAALCDETIRTVLSEMFANGFTKTDSYGCAIGKQTIRERVTETMFPKNGYDSPVTRVFREELEKALRGELKDLLNQAREQLKTLLQDDILGKLKTYLRDGMALK